MDEEKFEGGEEGEEEEEEEEDEAEEEKEEWMGRDAGVDPRRSLQLSESLPLHILPVWFIQDYKVIESF